MPGRGCRSDRNEAFWSRVDKSGECWVWTGGRTDHGYGRFYDGEKLVGPHRYSYEIAHGKIPVGLTIDHLCRTRACVNPSHLEAVTTKENTMRGNTITAKNKSKTHCKRGHEFTPENIYWRGQKRECRACWPSRGNR